MQHRTIFLIGIAVFSLLIAVLNGIAFQYSLYWSVWWFDILMHFFGGALVGFFILWGAYFFRPPPARIPARGVVIGGALMVGVAWEIFEFIVGARVPDSHAYRIDTMLDLFMDVVGALTVQEVAAALTKKSGL